MTNEQQAVYIRMLQRRLESELHTLNEKLLRHEAIPVRDLPVFFGDAARRPVYLNGLYELLAELRADSRILESQ